MVALLNIFYLIIGLVLSLNVDAGTGQYINPHEEGVPDIFMVYSRSSDYQEKRVYCVANGGAELTAMRIPPEATKPDIEVQEGRVKVEFGMIYKSPELYATTGLECQDRTSAEYAISAPTNSKSLLGLQVIPLSATVYPNQPLTLVIADRTKQIPYDKLTNTKIYSLKKVLGVDVSLALLLPGCPEGKFGESCGQDCPECHYGGVCHPLTGKCICPPGRTGDECLGYCEPQKIGRNCSFTLPETKGNQVCLPFPYGCSCLPGYSGVLCDQECSKETWGVNCKQSCSTCPDGICNSVTGVCTMTTLPNPCTIAPQPPTNIVVTDTTTTSITLSWQEPTFWKPCNLSYIVNSYGDGSVERKTVTTPYFRAENLTAHTTYGFEVRTVISGSQNLQSNSTELISAKTTVKETTITTEGNGHLNNTTTKESSETTGSYIPSSSVTTTESPAVTTAETESTTTTEGNRNSNSSTTKGTNDTTGSISGGVITTEPTFTTAKTGMCPAGELTFLNYSWSLKSTSAGSHADIPCRLDLNTSAQYGRWYCDSNYEWNKTPDLSSCRSPSLKFPSPKEGIRVYASENLTSLSESLEKVDPQPGDIIYINQGLMSLQTQFEKEISSFNETEALKHNEHFLNATITITDAMTKNAENWRAMPHDTVAVLVTNVLNRTSTLALSLAKRFTSSKTEIYERQNTYVYLTNQNRDHFDDEERRLFKDGNKTGTEIRLPEQFYHNYTAAGDVDGKSTNESDGMIVLVVEIYRNLHCAINTLPCQPPTEVKHNMTVREQINSLIVGATIGYGEKWYAEKNKPVEVKFSHIYNGSTYKLENLACVWWNTKTNSWSKEGCTMYKTTKLYTICHCDHLTNLAVIMDVNGKIVENKYLEMMTIVGCSLSIICLAISVACFLVVMIVRKKRAAVGIKKLLIRMNLCLCLLLAELILLTGLNKTERIEVCATVAALLHYFFLATFTWSAIESLNLYLFMVKIFESQISAKHYLIAGYGAPLVLVGLSLASTQGEGYGSEKRCWLESGGITWSFAGSLIFIMTVNLVAFVMTMRKAWQTRHVGGTQVTNKGPSSSNRKCACHNMNKLNSSLGIFLVLGLTWITGFLLYFEAITVEAAYLFVGLNSLQGVGIFIFGVALDKVVREELLQILHEKVRHRRLLTLLLCCLRGRNKVGPTTSSSAVSSSQLISENTVSQRYKFSSNVTSQL